MLILISNVAIPNKAVFASEMLLASLIQLFYNQFYVFSQLGKYVNTSASQPLYIIKVPKSLGYNCCGLVVLSLDFIKI